LDVVAVRILVVGAGAVGGYFGAHLAQAGRDVTFLVRPARAERLRRVGLVVHPAAGDSFTVHPAVASAGTGSAAYDLIVVAVKAYGLAQAMEDFAGAVGPGTAILPVLNGVQHLDALGDRFGPEHVLGGVCVIMAQLDADGGVWQFAPGASISYGELDGSTSGRIAEVDGTLQVAGFHAEVSSTIALDMWEKWLFLASGGALNTLLHGTVGQIEAVPFGVETARALVAEAAAVAAACGYEPRPAARQRVEQSLTKPGSTFTTSMYRDVLDENDVEADQILGDLVARGRRLGIVTPLLAAAYANLAIYKNGLAH